MRPVATPLTDTTQSLGWGRQEPLPLAVEHDVCVSTWELSEQDRERLRYGARIALAVGANPQPSVLMQVVAPFCERCEQPMAWSEQLKSFACPHEDEE